MGREKALLEAGGRTLLERALRALAERFESLHVSVGPGGPSAGLRDAVERFEGAGGPPVGIIADRLEGVGPAAGIHAALETIEDDRAFFLAVDLPRISFPLVDLLWEESEREDPLGCVPAAGGRLEPVYAVYSRPFAARIPALAVAGYPGLQGICRSLERVRIIDLDEKRWRDRVLASAGEAGARPPGIEELFRNINTPEEYRDWVAGSLRER
jgi:molybdopterin-guanine dinucleotide biosynthesis protein A